MNILLTGASGFLGSQLLKALQHRPKYRVTAAVRRSLNMPGLKVVEVGNLERGTDWSEALADQQVVVHAAARAHIMRDEVEDPLAEYRRINVDGTLSLARQAAAAGVKRFVFISSIKVNGEQTSAGRLFTADDAPAPADAYGISKWEAEQALLQLTAVTAMDVVIIRPPLVYGPEVKGNLASMIRWLAKGVPLPLGAVHNRRSLVSVYNLVDLVLTCLEHPAAANQVFLVSDGQDLSTTALLQGLAAGMGRSCRLVPVPVSFLQAAASLLGRRAVAQRLLGSLQVDITKTRQLLGWQPPVSVEDGFRRCFVE